MVAVADKHPLLTLKAHYATSIFGGHGAVRELYDIILLAQKLGWLKS
jgi:3-deoxy-D-manno-octulosonate 8-phosphate phosphatase (KDO 8-P phosphatase)